ncbi:MAG: serine/threonine protein kinase [Labilithrix sp.]|nr:serine/threonine protein kinase [Labilithrix sp.]MCW5818207.1 serine/threonine protein kinase [Labilithrix sp.]
MTTAAQARLSAGQQITKGVSLVSPLSSGGMGAVWLADHQGLKTRVVVKFMLDDLGQSEGARSRFSREAAAAAQVKSPHVVQMLDHGMSDDGVPFIVMEHLEGHDLGDEIERSGPLDPAKVVAIVIQVAKALAKVHAAGLLHRDIKPDNIFLVDGEEEVFVKLLDFGIAKSSVVDPDSPTLDNETKTGQIVGTPFYMSPEQVTAQKVIDLRSDLWALGVVAFEALTGQRPYDGPSFGALAVKIATGQPPKPSDVNPALPAAVDAWFARACAPAPADRFGSAKELADGLRAAFEGVVSMPMSASSDSGARDKPSSVPSGVNSALGFAKTALDDSGASGRRDGALARSEAGVSVGAGGGRARSPLLLFVIGGLVVAVGAVGFVVSRKQADAGPPLTPSVEPDVTVSSPPPPPPPPSAVAPVVTDTPPAAVEVDAGAPAPAVPSIRPVAPAVGPRPKPPPIADPPPAPAPPPKPSAKPNDDPLF